MTPADCLAGHPALRALDEVAFRAATTPAYRQWGKEFRNCPACGSTIANGAPIDPEAALPWFPRAEIARWMRRHLDEHTDSGEVDCTGLVEAWDIDNCDGEATVDENGTSNEHPAWDIAVEVADERDDDCGCSDPCCPCDGVKRAA